MQKEGRAVDAGIVFPSRAGMLIGKSNLPRYVFQLMIQRADSGYCARLCEYTWQGSNLQPSVP